jgi:hypothetical protein
MTSASPIRMPSSHHLVITTESRILCYDQDGLGHIFTSGSHGIVAAKEASNGQLAIADSQVVIMQEIGKNAEKSLRLKGNEVRPRIQAQKTSNPWSGFLRSLFLSKHTTLVEIKIASSFSLLISKAPRPWLIKHENTILRSNLLTPNRDISASWNTPPHRTFYTSQPRFCMQYKPTISRNKNLSSLDLLMEAVLQFSRYHQRVTSSSPPRRIRLQPT